VGTLYGDLDASPVTAALRKLAERGAIDPSRCELRLVGNVWLREPPDAGEVPVVETGYLEHRAALAQMREASVLLLYVPDSSPAPSGKIYEYLACGRPILCIVRRDNLAFRLVEESGAGRSAEPSDAPAIEAAICALYTRWEAGDLHVPERGLANVLARYSRPKLTRDLAEVLDAAVTSRALES
jgi:glycosyltransferase involved in cell wall biosynthesis